VWHPTNCHQRLRRRKGLGRQLKETRRHLQRAFDSAHHRLNVWRLRTGGQHGLH